MESKHDDETEETETTHGATEELIPSSSQADASNEHTA